MLGAVKHEREEILQKTSFAMKEVEVLTSQFVELQGEMERLRQDTPETDDFYGKEMADLISSTRGLRLSVLSSREEVSHAMKKLEDMRKEEEDKNILIMRDAQHRIDQMREEVEKKEIMAMELQSKLHGKSENVEGRKKALDDAMLTLQDQNSRNVFLKGRHFKDGKG